MMEEKYSNKIVCEYKKNPNLEKNKVALYNKYKYLIESFVDRDDNDLRHDLIYVLYRSANTVKINPDTSFFFYLKNSLNWARLDYYAQKNPFNNKYLGKLKRLKYHGKLKDKNTPEYVKAYINDLGMIDNVAEVKTESTSFKNLKNNELKEKILRILDTTKHGNLVYQIYFEENSQLEIAKKLKCSKQNIHQKVTRTLEILKKELINCYAR